MGCVSSSNVSPDLPAVVTVQQQQTQLLTSASLAERYALSTPASNRASPQSRPLSDMCLKRESDTDTDGSVRSRASSLNHICQNAVPPYSAAPAATAGDGGGVSDAASSTNSGGSATSGELFHPHRASAAAAAAAARSPANGSCRPESPVLMDLASAGVNSDSSFGSDRSERSGPSLSMTGVRPSRDESGLLTRGSHPSSRIIEESPLLGAAHALADDSTSFGQVVFNDEQQQLQQRQRRTKQGPQSPPYSGSSFGRSASNNNGPEVDGRAAPVNLPNHIPDEGAAVSDGEMTPTFERVKTSSSSTPDSSSVILRAPRRCPKEPHPQPEDSHKWIEEVGGVRVQSTSVSESAFFRTNSMLRPAGQEHEWLEQ